MINLGKAIYTILSGNTTVYSYVNNKIFPLVIPEKTILPCIVYERNSNCEYTRDGSGIYNSSLDITILSNNYTESINISQVVFNCLNMYKGTISNINIIDSRLTGLNETFAEDCYIQKLTFNIKSY